MKIYFNFFFCSAIYFRYSLSYTASFVDNGKECVILSPARCTKVCDCKNHITFNPQSWYRAFLESVKGKRCKCNDCRQTKKVQCKNGVCDTENQKCVCDYCWVGEVCDKFKNKHAPEFENTKLEVSIPKSHPTGLPVTRVTAYDRDLEFCNGENCPCGDVIYKLRRTIDLFAINEQTGSISITRTPELSRYELVVIATNDLDGQTTKEGNMNVTISVFDDLHTHHQPTVLYDDEGDEEEEDHYGVMLHHRLRRSVDANNVSHTLVVSATPKLGTTYYFNKNEAIVFEVKALNNGSDKDITSLKIEVTSTWLTLMKVNTSVGSPTVRFDTISNDATKVVIEAARLTKGTTFTAEITGVVSNNIGPLANLNLDLNTTFTQDGIQDIMLLGVKSYPMVYGVFPQVNVTQSSGTVATYDDVSVQVNVQLPMLNYHLLLELTTNVECFVFMEVKNVLVNHGSGISYTGSKVAVPHKSENSNDLVDRMVIDFGNVSVNGSEVDRSISISYDIAVKDHVNVANGSTHYAGTGLQAGPNVLWVDQQNFQITKIEPALEITYNKSLVDNSSRLLIGDIIRIGYRVEHTSTSEDEAKTLKVVLVSKHVRFWDTQNGATTIGERHEINTQDSLKKGKLMSGEFELQVMDTITPLISLPITLLVEYENVDQIKKFPSKVNVTLPLTGTPTFKFERVGSGDIVFGNKLKFSLTITLLRMNSLLQLEIVLPKYENSSANGTALMHITNVTVVSIGSKITDGHGSSKTVTTTARLFSTSDYPKALDQAVWDLGSVMNTDGNSTSPDNEIKIEFEALVLEVQNLTSGTVFKVGVGVIGMPRMVWVGQLNTTLLIPADRQPRMDFLHSMIGETEDEYQHAVFFQHSPNSTQYAYNVTFEYFLPPYVQYVSEVGTYSNIVKVHVPGGRSRFTLQEPLTFLDKFNHSIRVRLNRELSPKTGVFNFMVPCALTYTNYEHKRWQYWRSTTRSIHVRSRAPNIQRKPDAHSNYYGRGMYIHDPNREIYVCMNMHLPTARPACYLSKDSGNTWTAMDSRVGCVIGYHTDGNLYGVGRNQVVVIRYDHKTNDWYLLSENQKNNLNHFFSGRSFNDFSGVTTLEPTEIQSQHMDNSKLWGATDEWVYYRPTHNEPWAKKAKWRL